jgi:amino-acid N-acetyltransferase
MGDVKGIHALVTEGTRKGLLLPRSLNQIYTKLRDFWVVDSGPDSGPDSGVIGCCALQIAWESVAEVRSLLVSPRHRRRGIGTMMVNACLEEAKTFGISKVFCLTYQREFFSGMGFAEVAKETLPQKIWTDCIDCPKFPNCDEIAMARDVA